MYSLSQQVNVLLDTFVVFNHCDKHEEHFKVCICYQVSLRGMTFHVTIIMIVSMFCKKQEDERSCHDFEMQLDRKLCQIFGDWLIVGP